MVNSGSRKVAFEGLAVLQYQIPRRQRVAVREKVSGMVQVTAWAPEYLSWSLWIRSLR